MSSFTSDQTTINMTTVGSNTLARTGRCRITSIQAEGIAASTMVFYDSTSTGSPGTAVATYNYNTEGMQLFIPGSGILCKDGVVYNLTGAGGSVTITITGA